MSFRTVLARIGRAGKAALRRSATLFGRLVGPAGAPPPQGDADDAECSALLPRLSTRVAGRKPGGER